MLAGLELMGLGMGIVFSFLVLLVFTMQGMSKLAHTIEGKPPALTVASHDIEPESDEANDELFSVIAAAVHRYRATRR